MLNQTVMLNKKERVTIYANSLKETRQKRGCKSTDVATAVNICPMTYRRYENGERLPDVLISIGIAEKLGIKNYKEFKDLFCYQQNSHYQNNTTK